MYKIFPGDIFFIELAFSLMSENELSESDYLLKTLNEIKKLNPVVMTSLQFADISPNFEQIQNLSTSGLLFILSNPTVETDLKIHCAELLVKQGRISFEMLSEAYQLPRYDNADIENAIKLYKTLSYTILLHFLCLHYHILEVDMLRITFQN